MSDQICDRQTDPKPKTLNARQADTQADRQAGRQADRQTDRPSDRQVRSVHFGCFNVTWWTGTPGVDRHARAVHRCTPR
jgi:hypothetical protein